MDVEALASLASQKRCCDELLQQVFAKEAFILLSGELGSGRTAVCEQVVNAADNKLPAVFIPCQKDMQLKRLRELFLQQLLPNTKFDPNLNLADAIAQASSDAPAKKTLVVVDDADSVLSSFYNELLALHEEFLGKGRFAFILVCQPLWAAEKITRNISKVDLEQVQMPQLTTNEAMVLSRHIFAVHNTMRIYNSLVNKLPQALAPAHGNLSQIITITEKLMKDPTSAQANAEQAGKAGKLGAGKKKSSSVGIFVTVVCIIIVLACLIPIFIESKDQPSESTSAEVPNEEALVFADDTKSFAETTLQDEGALPQSVPGGIDAKTPEASTDHSVTLSGEELDKIEGGAHGSDYPRGVDRPVAPQANQPNNQLGNQQVMVPPQPVQQPIAELRRGDNPNHVSAGQTQHTEFDMPKPQPQPQQPANGPQMDPNAANLAAQLEQDRAKLEQAAREKLAADRAKAEAEQKAAEAKAKAEQAAKEAAAKAAADKAKAEQQAQQAQQTQRPAQRPAAQQHTTLKAGQVINLGDELRAQQAAQRAEQQAQRQPQPVADRQPRPVAAGNAVEGSLDELMRANGAHYTVQVVSASNRANIAAAAQGLSGRYWIVPSTRNGRPWYVLVFGDFPSRQAAMNAAAQVPTSVSQGASPFARRISEVQAEMRR